MELQNKGIKMKEVTVLPTKFNLQASIPERLKTLALDAEKFPEKYKHVLIMAVQDDLVHVTNFSSETPSIITLGVLKIWEEMILCSSITTEG